MSYNLAPLRAPGRAKTAACIPLVLLLPKNTSGRLYVPSTGLLSVLLKVVELLQAKLHRLCLAGLTAFQERSESLSVLPHGSVRTLKQPISLRMIGLKIVRDRGGQGAFAFEALPFDDCERRLHGAR